MVRLQQQKRNANLDLENIVTPQKGDRRVALAISVCRPSRAVESTPTGKATS
jgi:hypothetical protein